MDADKAKPVSEVDQNSEAGAPKIPPETEQNTTELSSVVASTATNTDRRDTDVPASAETEAKTKTLSQELKEKLEEIDELTNETTYTLAISSHIDSIEFNSNLENKDKISHLTTSAYSLDKRAQSMRIPKTEGYQNRLARTGGGVSTEIALHEYNAKLQAQLEQARFYAERAKECRDSARSLMKN